MFLLVHLLLVLNVPVGTPASFCGGFQFERQSEGVFCCQEYLVILSKM
jgi:hypothetical protein